MLIHPQISGTPEVLPNTTPAVSQIALDSLHKLNVDVKLSTQVTNTVDLPTGQTQVTLSTGQKLSVDLYIPTLGLAPNTEYLPSSVLNSKGFVAVDTHLRVKTVSDVYAVGDVNDNGRPQFMAMDSQSTYVVKSLTAALAGKTIKEYGTGGTPMMGLQIGKDMATGHYGSWRMPGWAVAWFRKDLFLHFMGPMVDGSRF